ncbi:SIMPL domain-containing protein [Isoalcanivorax beigongshangi]|uniref:SIMPL domain-containing protein n=1 Tax=Isoalcanivorax beigongshangi TaxID=3238810 RepID=A0ABV4AIC4_9GAMM
MLRRTTSSLLLLTAMGITLAGCGPQNSTPAPAWRDTLEVSGYGEVKASPDRFRVRAVSSRTGADISAMKQEVDAEISAALKASDALNIPTEQVHATNLSIQPEWQWQPERKLLGHRVAREIEFAVDGVESYAELLESLAKLGFTEVNQTGLEVGNTRELEEQALKLAVEDARRKAQILADAAGRTLGPVVNVTTAGGQMPQPVMYAMAERSADSSYRVGESSISENVQVRFTLE